MAEKYAFRNHFNLQNGEKCFIAEDKLIISSDYRIQPDAYEPTDGFIMDIRSLRLFINILFTILIFIVSFYFGIYPLILAMFLVMWDIKQLKRYRHKVSYSKCIAINSIERAQLRKGSFGFNYIDILFKTTKGELVMRPLKIYDSDEEFEVAINGLEKVGILEKGHHELARGQKIQGEIIACNRRTALVLGEDGLYFTEDGLYNPHAKDYYTNNNIIAYFLLIITGLMLGAHIVNLAQEGWNAPGVTLLIILLLVFRQPFKIVNRSNAHFIAYSSIIETKVIKNYRILVKFKHGRLKLRRKFPILHFKELNEMVEKINKKKN